MLLKPFSVKYLSNEYNYSVIEKLPYSENWREHTTKERTIYYKLLQKPLLKKYTTVSKSLTLVSPHVRKLIPNHYSLLGYVNAYLGVSTLPLDLGGAMKKTKRFISKHDDVTLLLYDAGLSLAYFPDKIIVAESLRTDYLRNQGDTIILPGDYYQDSDIYVHTVIQVNGDYFTSLRSLKM